MVVLRARVKELLVYGTIVSVILVIILSGLVYQLIQENDHLNLPDMFLITIVLLFASIVFNVFMFAYSLEMQSRDSLGDTFTPTEL